MSALPHKRPGRGRRLLAAAAALLGLWLLLEAAVRSALEWPLATDFYSSIPRHFVRQRQAGFGLQLAGGIGWAHLGWIADPGAEQYRVERRTAQAWEPIGRAKFGSYLLRQSGSYRVWAEPADAGPARLLGEVSATVEAGQAPVFVPRIAGPWQTLFRPQRHGRYINDHTVYQDAGGRWRVLGITSQSDGNYAEEKYFASGSSSDFPPAAGMREETPVADFGALAWAPHVLTDSGGYSLFWSPHQLHRMTSADGITWADHRVVMPAPMHRFFRDAMILKLAPGQWLLYSTARGRYFSRVDLYQSFDLEGWQYIGAALDSGWGSERNAIVASTESPAVARYRGRYYLALTYNNDSFFWPAALLAAKVWLDPPSYNDTLVFHADNPYDFGTYRGVRRSPSLLTRLAAHAAELVYQPQQEAWYITTAGWPWVATLTNGEVAVAPLVWEAD
ncbi:MAG: hypothetical protein HY699_02375 [Deltaproteobacteria bacterium]|nr:hypothetical protein [Deltaproteobacteria bacterium]